MMMEKQFSDDGVEKKAQREGMKRNSGSHIYVGEISEVSKMDGGGDMGDVGNVTLGEGKGKRRYNLRRKGNGKVEGENNENITCIGKEGLKSRVEGDVCKRLRINDDIDKDSKLKGRKGRKEENSKKGKEPVLGEDLVDMEDNKRRGTRRMRRKKGGGMDNSELRRGKNCKLEGPMNRDLNEIKDKLEAPVIRSLRSGKNYMFVAPVKIRSCRSIFRNGDVGKGVDEKKEEGLFCDERKSVGEQESWGEGKSTENKEEDSMGDEIGVGGVEENVKKKGEEVIACDRKVEESRRNNKRKRNFFTDDEKEDDKGKESEFMRKEKTGTQKKMKKTVRFQKEYKGDDEEVDEEFKKYFACGQDENENRIGLRSREILKISRLVEGKGEKKIKRMEKNNGVKEYESENISLSDNEKEKKKEIWRVQKNMKKVEGRGRLTRSKIRGYEEDKLRNKIEIGGSKKERLLNIERTGARENIKKITVGEEEMRSLRKKTGVRGMYGERSDGEKIDEDIYDRSMDEMCVMRKEGEQILQESSKFDVERKRSVMNKRRKSYLEGKKGEVESNVEVMKEIEMGAVEEVKEDINKEKQKEYGGRKNAVDNEDVEK